MLDPNPYFGASPLSINELLYLPGPGKTDKLLVTISYLLPVPKENLLLIFKAALSLFYRSYWPGPGRFFIGDDSSSPGSFIDIPYYGPCCNNDGI
jgi:hypothetical protein